MPRKVTTAFDKVWSQPGVRGLRVGPARWTGVPLLMGGKPPQPAPRAPIPRNRSSFYHFFNPIAGMLGDFYLLSLPHLWWGDPWTDPDFVAMTELIHSDKYIPPGLFFPQFAKYVGEGDWMDLYFLREPPPPKLLRVNLRKPHPNVDPIDVWIENVDGAYWLLFAKDQQLLDTVRSHMRGRDGFFCEPELLPPGP